MDLESYEYTGMMAAAWDLLRGDTSSWLIASSIAT